MNVGYYGERVCAHGAPEHRAFDWGNGKGEVSETTKSRMGDWCQRRSGRGEVTRNQWESVGMPPRKRVMLSARGEVCVRYGGPALRMLFCPRLRVTIRGTIGPGVVAGCGFRGVWFSGSREDWSPVPEKCKARGAGIIALLQEKKGAGIAHGERAAERSLSFF